MSNKDSNKNIQGYQLGQNHQVEQIWLKYHSCPEGMWITKINESIKLHDYLKEFQPKFILELGTGIGCSTEIMAFTCPESSIYTLEQNPRCIEIAKKMIPDALKDRIYFKYVKPAVMKPIFQVNPNQYFACYSTPYDRIDYDFIYIDGPGPFKTIRTDPETKESWECLADLPGGDIIDFLHRTKPGAIFYLDGRKFARNLYKRHLMHYLDLILEDEYRTIFKRNQRLLNPDLSDFMNSDLLLKVLKDNNYFYEEIKDEE